MALTINFRNNSDLFAKISGVFDDKVITPNSVVEDKTIQWDENSTNGEKNISLYPTEDCNTAPSATLKVPFCRQNYKNRPVHAPNKHLYTTDQMKIKSARQKHREPMEYYMPLHTLHISVASLKNPSPFSASIKILLLPAH